MNTANKQPGPLYCKVVSNGQGRVCVCVFKPRVFTALQPAAGLAPVFSYLLLLSWKAERILRRKGEGGWEEYISLPDC